MARTNYKPHASLLKKLNTRTKRPQALIAAATTGDAARHLNGLEPPLAEPLNKRARTDATADPAALMRRIAALTKQLCEAKQQQASLEREHATLKRYLISTHEAPSPTPKQRPSSRSIGTQTDPVPEIDRYNVTCGEFYGQVSWDTHRLRRPILEHAIKRAAERGKLRPRAYPFADCPEGSCLP